MASLLDLVLQRQNPVAAGLLASGRAPEPEPAPTPAPAPSGDGGFLSRLVTGGNDPSLSPEQNRDILRQSLITGGAAALRSDEPGIGALGDFILTGQQFAAGAKATAVAEAEKAEAEQMRADILEQGDLSTQAGRVRTVQQLLAAGLGEDAQRIINVMGEFEAPQILSEGENYRVFDPNTREITDTGVKIPAAPGDTAFQQIGDTLALIDKQSGDTIKAWDNPDRLSAKELRSLANDAMKQTTGLRKEFQDLTEKAQEAINLADSALIGPEGDPATGQTLVVALNKILDPNSVVRESEFARVHGLGGILARLDGYAKQLERGQLPQETEASVRAEIARLRAAMADHVADQATFYTGLAAQNSLNPDQVVRPSLVESLDEDPLSELEGLGN